MQTFEEVTEEVIELVPKVYDLLRSSSEPSVAVTALYFCLRAIAEEQNATTEEVIEVLSSCHKIFTKQRSTLKEN